MKRLFALGLGVLFACQKSESPPATPPAEAPAVAPTALVAAPATKVEPVKDKYHGTEVTDPYRWLEDGKDPAVKAWSDAQNAHARAHLDRLPQAAALKARLTEILKAEVTSFSDAQRAGGRYFVKKRQPPKQQPFLVVLESLDAPDTGKVVLDPTVLDPSGTTALDWYVPSPDGRLVAVSLSKGGTESGDVTVLEVDTGKTVDGPIPRVNGGTAGGDLAWAKDGKGFYYTRYPRGEERPAEDRDFYQQLYFHALGTPGEQDRYELGQELPRIAEIQLQLDRDSGLLLATVQNGDGGEFAHYLKKADGQWAQLTTFADKIVQMTFGPNQDLYLISRNEAPRGKVLRMSLQKPDWKTAQVVVPEGEDTVVSDFWGTPTVLPTESRLYVEYQLGGPSELRVFDLSGKRLSGPEQLPVAAVGGVVRLDGEEILFQQGSFVEPLAYFRYDPGTGRTVKTGLANGKVADFEGVEVVREKAKSKDGTLIPVNLLLPKGFVKDGQGPMVVTGYGGYGVNLEPRYNPGLAVLLEHGVAYGIANLRGGAEFGATWHEEGRLTKKQNVFDDFLGVLEHLVAEKYSNPKRLGITGGSNGGLLMGAALTQRPELMKAVVSFVGIYDMLRVELSSNGAFNVTEFGTVKDPAQFQALYAYSPYHHVKDGAGYPPILFLTGENDPRVDPMQSRKMTARLQAATANKVPVLLRTSGNSGHGGDISLDERIAQSTDAYAFLLDQLGVK